MKEETMRPSPKRRGKEEKKTGRVLSRSEVFWASFGEVSAPAKIPRQSEMRNV